MDREQAGAPRTVVGDLPEGQAAGHPMDIWISYALRFGVSVAALVILAGLVVFLALGPRTGESPTLHGYLHGQHPVSLTPAGIFRAVGNGEPLAVIYVGLFLLILTPVLRVAMTVILFLAQRDWIFVLVTATVLAVLIVGVIGIGS